MTHRLFLIEELPCSGKSTTAAFVAAQLRSGRPVSFVDEGTGQHPADYEFHALAPAGFLSDKAQIVSLADFSGEQFNQLLAHKIYDFLPWETEKPLMLDKWRSFVSTAERDTAYVFNCVFLQNPMCETMMRFDFPLEVSHTNFRLKHGTEHSGFFVLAKLSAARRTGGTRERNEAKPGRNNPLCE